MAVLAVLMVAVQYLDLARAREPKGNPTQEESTRKEKEEEEQIPKILKKRQKKMTVVVDRSYGSDRSDQSLLSCDSVTRQKESSTCT
jgi:predicted double-glycine peptidase